jgi:hypothetical protein
VEKQRVFLCAALMIVVVTVMVAAAGAGVPRKINYQGRLTDATTGEPPEGPLNLTFRIYDDAFSSSPMWEEGHVLTADSAGVVSAILGSIVSIDVAFGDAAWLEVEVGGEVLSPRREIVSVPYAFRAVDADSLGGEPASAYVVKGESGSITVEMVVSGAGSGLNADMVDSLHAAAFADSGHVHDERYYLKAELNTSGTINASENPVDWTKLKGVPAGFADGTDDMGGTGDGHSLDAADGSPTDVVYVDGGGHVGVGTTTPDDMLDIAGDADLMGDLKMGGTPVFSVDLVGNTAIGSDAGHEATGGHNTFTGFVSGLATTTGFSNVFTGAYSGQANTIGYANTFVGYSSGAANDSGWGNTCLGYLSGNTNIDADINTFLGYYSGKANTTGDGNTFVGAVSGWLNTEGEYNTCVGGASGYYNVTGNSNTYVGYGAGPSTGDGEGNVFLGCHAGGLEIGSNKLCIANDINDPPLIYGDFSTKQVGIGTKTLEAELNVAGGCNVSTAYCIAGSTVVAVQEDLNTHLGIRAGEINTSYSGTFVGYHAGRLNAGGANTFLGAKAGAANTSGVHNTFLGALAGMSNDTGQYNTYLGTSAGQNVISGGQNTIIGAAAGVSAGSGNVFLGYMAGNLEFGSNKLYIANGKNDDDALIYGDFSTGKLSFGGARASAYDFDFESSSSSALVIGNDQAWIDFGVGGNSRISLGDGDGHRAGVIYGADNTSGDNYIAIWSHSDVGTWIMPTCFHENGYVGIGTTEPDREIHIVSHNPRILIEAESSNPEVNFRSSNDAFGDTWAVYKDSTTNDLRFYQNGDKVTIEATTGNVGIGTTNPGSYRLYVSGDACGTGAWGSCSDLRFKDNIEGIGDALGKILSLRGVTFDWKRDEYPDMNFDEGTHYGCIAQEVEEVLPEVVREGPDGDKAVAYSEIVPVLIESIKAQQRQIELLEARIAELEK